MSIRVRFAPSPTGYLHLGGARTALFNWLFAKRKGGTFILRIEDTDEVRSTNEAVLAIIRGLEWLGMNWNEGPKITIDRHKTVIKEVGEHKPYFQMKRLELYRKYAEKLIEDGKAYRCYCFPEELEEMRKKAIQEKRPPKYDGRCRNLTAEDEKIYKEEGRKPVVRFKTPQEGVTEFEDIVRGKVSFQNNLLDDFVMLKSSGSPTYNFAVVVDDHEMEISHVIRGDDHISNTPRQILLYEALGWEKPQFAHVPMILGSDGSRLSKRHGATSLEYYEKEGYLPEAMVNYLALLGWATEDSQQIFDIEELKEKFSLERCAKSAAIFDLQKLLWMNGEYIRKMEPDELTTEALPFIIKENLIQGDTDEEVKQWVENILTKAISLEQEKIKLLKDIPYLISYMLKEDLENKDYEEEAKEKVLKVSGVKQILSDCRDRLTRLEDFSEEKIEQEVRNYTKESGKKTSEVFHPIRVAVSGRTRGPGLFALLSFLGKERVLKRIDYTIKNFL
ncbi:Glutamate--tRNA ligase 1 [subsurface metagenome]|nr:glutamate--tRNA ligase [Clostridia bacterium]